MDGFVIGRRQSICYGIQVLVTFPFPFASFAHTCQVAGLVGSVELLED